MLKAFMERSLRVLIGRKKDCYRLGQLQLSVPLMSSILPAMHAEAREFEFTALAKMYVENRLDAASASASELFRVSNGLPTDDKARKELQLWTFLMEYFPDAWLAIVGVAVAGNKQHNPGQPLHWARHKSTDQMNTAFRHMWDYGRGVKRDTDGQYHLAKAAWRLMAQLQLDIEADRK